MLTASWGQAEQAKGADGMHSYICVVDCIAYIVDAERDECLLVGMIAPW